jgi:hypothetical protein
MSNLPKDAKARKAIPIGTGVLDYFPLALIEVAKVSKAGNDQHNPGQKLHWDRTKSQDESDALLRHYLDRYEEEEDGTLHAAHMVWRGLAFLQKLCEERNAQKIKEAAAAEKQNELKQSQIQYSQIGHTGKTCI